MTQGEINFKKKKLTGRKLKCYLILRHFFMQEINRGWVKNWILQHVDVGAVSGLRSLRKLSTEFGIDYRLIQLLNSDGEFSGTWAYKLKSICLPTNVEINNEELRQYQNYIPYILWGIVASGQKLD